MKKKTKNYVIAAVVIALGIVTCAIAVNTGGQSMMQEGNWDSQEALGMGMDESNPVAGEKIEFSTKDLEGNDVDSSVFAKHDLTIINLWSPSCSPCVGEMPDIQKLQDEYKDRIKVIGVIDKYDKNDAPDTLKSLNITYTNVVADAGLQKIVNEFMYIPVTIFVDSDGNIHETYVPGSTDYQSFKAVIDELLG